MQALIRVAASIQAANFPKAASDRTINRKLFSNLVVGLIYSTASDVAINTEFLTKEDLFAYTTELSSAIEDFQNSMANDSTGDINWDDFYAAMDSLRAKFVNMMMLKGEDLTKVIEIKIPSGAVSSLLIAYTSIS